MSNRLTRTIKILYYLGILGAEMAIIWGIIQYFSPILPYESKNPIDYLWFEWIDPSLPIPFDTFELANEINNANSQTIPIFTTGTSEEQILATLGEPVWRQPGYWDNSTAWLYEDIAANNIDLGYLFDIRTKKLRQTEIAVPPSTNLETLQNVLDGLLGDRTSAIANQGLEAIYLRHKKRQTFKVGNLEGIIQRNDRDRIYIGIWEADFH